MPAIKRARDITARIVAIMPPLVLFLFVNLYPCRSTFKILTIARDSKAFFLSFSVLNMHHSSTPAPVNYCVVVLPHKERYRQYSIPPDIPPNVFKIRSSTSNIPILKYNCTSSTLRLNSMVRNVTLITVCFLLSNSDA